MPDIVVRLSCLQDMNAIQAIYAHHVLHGLASFEEIPPGVAELAERRASVLARGLPYLVAELDGAVVGYAYAGPYRTRSAYRYTLEDSVYVGPGLEGRGVGRALLTRLVAECERLGCRQLIAVIGDSGNAGSIGLHAALGFRHAGLLPSIGFKHGRWVDSVLMQRPLGPGDETLPE
ncbi:MAG TPA: GNAT family N-acetyltransferase [Azospirillum sp.]|nr:GNAT family N-acetyltransferase [Azospirillum sp.]